MRQFRSTVSLLFFLFSVFTSAKEIALFRNGGQVSNYNELLASLQEGDILLFDGGRRFVYKKTLGNGGTTKILEVSADGAATGRQYPKSFALRIPLAYPNGRYYYPEYIDAWAESHSVLVRSGAPVPKMYDTLPEQFIAVEKLDLKFTLLDYLVNRESIPLQYRNNIQNVPEELREPAERAFKQLVADMKNAGRVGDFHYGQLAFDVQKQKWYLVDWSDSYAGIGSLQAHPLGPEVRKNFLKTFPPPVTRADASATLIKLEAMLREIKAEPTLLTRCFRAMRTIAFGY